MEVGICNIYIQQGTHIQTIHEKLLQINQTAQYKKRARDLNRQFAIQVIQMAKTHAKKKKIIMKKHSEKSSISIVVREININ